MRLPDTENRKATITREILSEDRNLLESYSIEHYIQKLNSLPKYSPYNYVSPELEGIGEQLYLKGKDHLLANYHKLVLMTLIDRFKVIDSSNKLPQSVRSLCKMEFERIIAEMDTNEEGFYQYTNDLFLRDLGLSRHKLVPVGVGMVEPVSGIPRSVLLKGGLRQLVRALWFFAFEVRGFRPLYLIHTNPRALGDFNPEGWDRAYLQTAELLELNSEIKGTFRSNWFIDPQLQHVSPRLTYLRRRWEENGAKLFYVGTSPDAIKNALTKSATRRKLNEEGKYIPTNYLQVWPRKEMLRWGRENMSRVTCTG